MTLSQAVRRAADDLRMAGLDEPMSEARWLVAAALGSAAIDLVVAGDRTLDVEDVARIADFTRRRAAHEPLSRILGLRQFYGRDFALSAGTLDPRPDTEVVVDLVLELLRGTESSSQNPSRKPPQDRSRTPISILDVGTGSGAILVTLLAELPDARGTGIDISEDALATAAGNARRHGVAERATLLCHDIRDGTPGATPAAPAAFPGSPDGRYDLIVSNPPYIPTCDLSRLQPEVRLHDPPAALDGGTDGLDFYRLLAATIPHLTADGWLVVEVGAGQAPSVADLFLAAAPESTVRTAVDLAGHTRVVAVQPRLA